MYNKNNIIKKEYNYYWVNEAHNNKRSNGGEYDEDDDNYLDNVNSETTSNQNMKTTPMSQTSIKVHKTSTNTQTISTNTTIKESKSNVQTQNGKSEPTPSTNSINNNVPNDDTSLDSIFENGEVLTASVNNTYENENLTGIILSSINDNDTPNISNVSSVDKSVSGSQESDSITCKLCIAFVFFSALIICIIYFVNERVFRSKTTKKNTKNIKEVIDIYQDVSKENFHNFSLIAYQNLSTMKGNSNSSKHSTYNFLMNTPSNHKPSSINTISNSPLGLYSNAGSPSNEHIEIQMNIPNDIPKAVMNTYQYLIDSKNIPNETMITPYNNNDISKSIMSTPYNNNDISKSIMSTPYNNNDISKSIMSTPYNNNDISKSIMSTPYNNNDISKSIMSIPYNNNDISKSVMSTSNNNDISKSIMSTSYNNNDISKSVMSTSNNNNDISKSVMNTSYNSDDISKSVMDTYQGIINT